MKITAVKAQVKNPSRYSIFIDHKYAFSLSDEALLETSLAKDQTLSPAELKRFKQLSAEDKLYQLTLNWLARRARSAWEVSRYLATKKASEELADTIVAKLNKIGLIDDQKFAAAWVRDRTMYKNASRRRLTYELRQKKVSSDVIGQALADLESTDEMSLENLVAIKRRQAKYQDDLKLMQYLSRQGFNYGDIKEALAKESDQA